MKTVPSETSIVLSHTGSFFLGLWFGLIIFAVVATIFGVVILGSLPDDEVINLKKIRVRNILIYVMLATVWFFTIYATLGLILNKTYLKLESQYLIVEQRPFPFNPRKQIEVHQLANLFINDFTLRINGSNRTNYRLMARLNTGSAICLYEGFDSEFDAQRIAEQIETHYDLSPA